MKKLFIILAVLAVSGAAHGQISNPDVVYVTVAPSGACASAPPIQVVISTGTAYTCNNGTWAAVSGGGGSAITALTGDVTATGPGSAAASVVKVNGAAIAASQSCLASDGSSHLVPCLITPKFNGVVIPVIQTANAFDNLGAALPATPFAIAGGGGLISSVGGTTASGYRHLPREALGNRVTRTDFQILWNQTETGASMTVGIGLSSSTYNVNLANSGGNFVATFFQMDGTTKAVSGSLSGAAANITVDVSITTGNGYITSSVCIPGAQLAISAANPWLSPCQFTVQRYTTPRLTVAYFATNTVTSKIVGWLHNADGLDGDPNGQLLTETVVDNLSGVTNPGISLALNAIAGSIDHENFIIIPPRPSFTTPLKPVFYFHGRTGYMTDFCVLPAVGPALELNVATCSQLVAAGYAVIGEQGGSGLNNIFSDAWGNPASLEKFKFTYDAFVKNNTNTGHGYAIGWSMGGTSALNFARQYPGIIVAEDLDSPAIDLNDATAVFGIQVGVLKTSIDLAYNQIWLSLAAGNVGNNPATDGGVHWVPMAEAGALADIGARSWQVTTSGVAANIAQNVPLASAAVVPPGTFIYFPKQRALRKVVYKATGVPNNVDLDGNITLASGDPVLIEYPTPQGPDPGANDFNWANFYGSGGGASTIWAVGTTYAQGAFIFANSSNPALDESAWNPLRSPESYSNTFIDVNVANPICADNDGTLADQQMCNFGIAVNAIYPSNVTTTFGVSGNGGGHVSGAINPTRTLALFAAHP